MTEFKDLFSVQASDYARYRPGYPAELFTYLRTLVKNPRVAWDAGTGNGQAAQELAKFFPRVIATDPSDKQLQSALPKDNITYLCEPAEAPTFTDKVDLITVAQAFHWFRHADFAEAVKKVAAPDCHLVVWSYGKATVTPQIDAAVEVLYTDILENFWEKERRDVENGYQNIALPFTEIPAPKMNLTVHWTREELTGYFKTWSAFQTYLRKGNPEAPVRDALGKILEAFGEGKRTVSWPMNIRVWRVNTDK